MLFIAGNSRTRPFYCDKLDSKVSKECRHSSCTPDAGPAVYDITWLRGDGGGNILPLYNVILRSNMCDPIKEQW